MRRIPLVVVITAAAALSLAACSDGTGAAPAAPQNVSLLAPSTSVGGQAADPGVAPATITTSGTGKVKGTPDILTIGLGVETRAATAKDAMDLNNAVATDVIATLEGSGVADADLQTSQLSVYPTWDNNGQITGYQVNNTVTATLRDTGAAGTVIDAVAQKAGDATRVQQLTFSIDDDSTLRAAARADAVDKAQAQAEQLATAAGVTLGTIRSITEVTASSPYPNYYAADAMAAGSAAASVPIEAGSQELSVSVQVVYNVLQ